MVPVCWSCPRIAQIGDFVTAAVPTDIVDLRNRAGTLPCSLYQIAWEVCCLNT